MPKHIAYAGDGTQVAENRTDSREGLQSLWWWMAESGYGVLSGAYVVTATGVTLNAGQLWMQFGDKPIWEVM